MKNRLLSILFALLAGTGAVFAQSEVTPPAFNGAVIRVFMTRMAATVEKIAIEQQIPADSISPVAGIALQIDKAGNVAEWRYMDNTQEGRDHAEFAPATAATRRAMEKAYDRLGGTWSPATLADGSPVSYTSRMTIRIPVEKIRRAQDADPLLFMGENPDENFHAWAKMRIRYDGRFTEKGVEGVVHVRFYIEPDGRIAIGEVVQSPDERLTKEVLRVIRSLAEQHMTMIIVTHEMAFARDVADRVIFMDGGVIVEQGPAHDVIENPQAERTKQFLARYRENQ